MVSRALAATALVLILGGCSTIKGWFGSKQDGKPSEPAELVDITPSVAVSKLWSANAGKGEERLGLQQTPAIDGGRVYTAAVEGACAPLTCRPASKCGSTSRTSVFPVGLAQGRAWSWSVH